MIQEHVLVRDPVVTLARRHPRTKTEDHEQEILRVLERAAADDLFIAELTDHGPEALADYDLSWEERAALLSGDIRWIEARLGKLNARLHTWLECRLQQEIW